MELAKSLAWNQGEEKTLTTMKANTFIIYQGKQIEVTLINYASGSHTLNPYH